MPLHVCAVHSSLCQETGGRSFRCYGMRCTTLTLVTQPRSHIIPPSQPRSAPKAIDAAFCAIKSTTVPCRSAPGGFPPQAFLREERPEKRPHALACSGSSASACCWPFKMTQGRLAVPAISSKLNPYAQEFRPKRALPNHDCTVSTCALPAALGHEGQASVACDPPAVLRFMDVPSEVTRYAFLPVFLTLSRDMFRSMSCPKGYQDCGNFSWCPVACSAHSLRCCFDKRVLCRYSPPSFAAWMTPVTLLRPQ